MEFNWTVFVDLGVISLALMLATLARAKLILFQKFRIPNALSAGFILLVFYNFLSTGLGHSSANLGHLIYHLLSLSFIAMSLRSSPGRKTGKRVLSTALVIVSSITLQGILGYGLTFLFIATLVPTLHPGFGLLLPLGYEMGPGQAYAIGTGWEALGFVGGGSVGLTFAAFGFLWACFGGVVLINIGVKRGWLSTHKTQLNTRHIGGTGGIFGAGTPKPVGALLTTDSEAIDSLSVNFGIVFATYLLTFILLKGVTFLLSFAGSEGRELAVNLWGLSFIFAALLALLVKKIMSVFEIDHILETQSLTRITGISVDFMVAAAVGAISLVMVLRYWIPLLIIGLLGGLLTILYIFWMTSRLFKDHHFQRAIMFYGASTGTLPTGLALLRITDPEFKSPAAVDYMYGSGVAFFLVIPYILAMNLPAYGLTRSNPALYWRMTLLLGIYLLVVIVLYRLLAGRDAFAQPFKLWYPKQKD